MPTLTATVLSLALNALVHSLASGLTGWLASGDAAVMHGALRALSASTAVPLNAGFLALFRVLREAGPPLGAGFFFLALIRTIVHQDLGELGRLVLVRLPLAIGGAGVVLQLLSLSLGASDALAAALLRAAGGAVESFAGDYAATLVALPRGGFAVAVIAVLGGVLGLVMWLELVVRASALAVAALFVPISLCGALWPATASWPRRLGEVLGALVLAKVAMAAVFALALTELGTASGLSGLVQGTALLVLAVCSPWALLRLIPVVEAGAVSHLEAAGRGARRGARALAAGGLDQVMDGRPDFIPTPSPTVSMFEGVNLDTPEFRASVDRYEAEARGRDGADGAGRS